MLENMQESCSYPKKDKTTCAKVGTQYADVGVPIKLKPFVVVGEVETQCSGEPLISLHSGPAMNCCCGGCEVTIMQSVAIRIPLTYGTIADVGEATVNCKRPPNC